LTGRPPRRYEAAMAHAARLRQRYYRQLA